MRIPEDIPPHFLEWGAKYLWDDWYLTPVSCDHQLEWRYSMADQSIDIIYGDRTPESSSLSEEEQKKISNLEEEAGACYALREFIRTLPAWNGGWPTDAEISSD